MAAAQKSSQLGRILSSVAPVQCKNSRKVRKTRSAIRLQNWWQGIRRQRMRKLCEQILTRNTCHGVGSSCSISPSWIFLKNQNISAAFLYFLTWDNGWTHRAGPWRFSSNYHSFRTKNESRYCIADRVWRSVWPSKAPKQYGRKGEILYDPVLRQFILEELEPWGTERVRVFNTMWDVLLHVRYTNHLERLRMRSHSASFIQYFWREAHGYKYVRPRAVGEQTDSDSSDSDSDDEEPQGLAAVAATWRRRYG